MKLVKKIHIKVNIMKRILVLFFFVLSNISMADWVSLSGPANPVKTILKYDYKIYAASYGSGVNAYDLDGLDWSTVNTELGNLNVWQATNFGTDLFAATDAGIYKLTSFAGSWKKVSSTLGGMAFYFITSDSKRIYVANDNNNIYYSTNSGTEWKEVSTGDLSYNIRSLTLNNGILYVGSQSGKIFKTTDDGTTWNEINNAPLLFDINDVKFVNGKIFAGTKEGGMFMSADGLKWSAVNTGLTSSEITCILAEGNKIFVSTKGKGVFFTVNDGTSWIQAVEGMGNADCYTLYSDGKDLYTATSNNELMKRSLSEFDAAVLVAPVLTSPINDAVDIELDNVFNWNNAIGALYYHPIISLSQDFSDTVDQANNHFNNYFKTTKLKNETTYYWKVGSISATKEVKWSEIRKFTTVKYNDVTDELSNSVAVFPNPVNDFIVLNTNNQPIDFVKVYNLNGELVSVYNFALNSNVKLDISELKSGSYFAVSKINNSIVKKKFIKVK